MKEQAIRLFENYKVRSVWNSDEGKWYISIVDVVEVLTESLNPRKYWSVLKTRLKQEGNQTATNCSQLKLLTQDGKMRLTDVADVKSKLSLHCHDNWLRNRSTIEFLGLWKKIHSPNFKGVEFDPLLVESGTNAFTMSPKRFNKCVCWKMLKIENC